MFERFTERARRTLFFARYEASQFGSTSIEPEHLLLGVLREGKGLTSRLFAGAGLTYGDALEAIRSRVGVREKVATSVEIPFSGAAKRILQRTAEEADRLGHNYVGTEHLLMGIAGEPGTLAASILQTHGLLADAIREAVIDLLGERAPDGVEPSGEPPTLSAVSAEAIESHESRVLTQHVDRISQMLGELASEVGVRDNPRVIEMIFALQMELQSLRELRRP